MSDITRTLWTFGDSFTESYLPKKDVVIRHWRHEYIEWKGYVPKVYGEVLSERWGMELKNYGMGSWDNYSIFESFCNVVDKINKDDIIIFGWSSPERYRIVGNGGYWKQMAPAYDRTQEIVHNLSETTIDELFVNRTHIKYAEEVNSWIKLINFTLKDNAIIHWSPFKTKINVPHIGKLEMVKTETKGFIDDGHYSENGQKELANILEKIYHRLINKEIL